MFRIPSFSDLSGQNDTCKPNKAAYNKQGPVTLYREYIPCIKHRNEQDNCQSQYRYRF